MGDQRTIWSVAELNRRARQLLESHIGEVWVEGELSRLTRHASGHWYFTLKDPAASVSCALFKANKLQVSFEPRDGQKVRILARASLYEARGNYQLIARAMEAAGPGSLQEQFERLKAQLAAEGLFDAARKKKCPLLPRTIGVVTSPTGAAVRDILQVLTRRFPNLHILLAPVLVQGAAAAASIARAIDYLNRLDTPSIDLLIVGRGGGSLEDLWAFNEEVVARAIAKSHIPVISAVGHEIDFTIADFVADLRAPTPSAAAELAVPVQSEVRAQLAQCARRLGSALHNRAHLLRERIPHLQQTMKHQLLAHLQQRQQRLDEAALRMTHALKNSLLSERQRLPRIQQTMAYQLQKATAEKRQAMQRLDAQLRTLNPLRVLERGYSITETDDGHLVRRADELAPGQRLKTRFADGALISEVKEVHHDRKKRSF